MKDPIDGLKSLQLALNQGLSLNDCTLYPELKMIFDQPNGCNRLTYAMVESGIIKSYSTLILSEPLQGKPCFNIGYATSEAFQSIGLASEIVEKSINELKHGFLNNNITEFYIEAVISVENIASLKVANKILSAHPSQIVDEISGENAYYYKCLVN